MGRGGRHGCGKQELIPSTASAQVGRGVRTLKALGFTPPDDLEAVVAAAIAEDLGTGDLTAALVPGDRAAAATVITREPTVVLPAPC